MVVGFCSCGIKSFWALYLSDFALGDLLKRNIPALTDLIMAKSEKFWAGAVELSRFLPGVLYHSVILEDFVVNGRPIVKLTLGIALTLLESADLDIGDVNIQAFAVVAWVIL